MQQTAAYKGATNKHDANGPSPILWADCPLAEIALDSGLGTVVKDDFTGTGALLTTECINGWYSYIDTNAYIRSIPTAEGGLLLFSTADNEECAAQWGGPYAAPFAISDTAGSDLPLWFECCVKRELITDDLAGCFVGLASEGAAANSFIADAGNDFADVDLLGFWLEEADGDNCKAIYQITGGALTTNVAALTAIAADTYIRLGFRYDPLAPTAKRITWYVNGVENATYVTGTQIAAATFPDGEEMSPIIALKDGNAADFDAHCLWIQCVQLKAKNF